MSFPRFFRPRTCPARGGGQAQLQKPARCPTARGLSLVPSFLRSLQGLGPTPPPSVERAGGFLPNHAWGPAVPREGWRTRGSSVG